MPKQHVSFEVIAGTYEEYLLGYVFSSETKNLTQSFASHDHSSSIRCLAVSDQYLASGASDDRIIVYDLKVRKEHCMLTHHNSTVTALVFTNDHSHIISGSEDGVLAMVRVGNWQLEKIWDKAHKGAVLDIAMQQSGKLALTLGSDRALHTWNLVKGRSAFILNISNKCKDPKSAERIIFAPDGVRFVIYGGKFTEIWSIERGGALKVIEHAQKVTACVWLDVETLFVGYEDGNIARVDIDSEETKKSKTGHTGRIKAAQYFEGFIITASSNGEIKVWTRKLKEIAKVDTGCRITCLSVAHLMSGVKKEEEQLDEEEETVKKRPQVSRVLVEVESSDGEDNRQPRSKKKKLVKEDATARNTKRKIKTKRKKNND